MKILSSSEIRKVDANTITNQHIPSIELMERAAAACAKWISTQFSKVKQVTVFCGSGNNGGDGLAIARLLFDKGYLVKVILVGTGNQSQENSINLKRLSDYKKIEVLNFADLATRNNLKSIAGNSLVVDAILGTGINRAPDTHIAEVIHTLNALPNSVVAIDIPSGLFSDSCSVEHDSAIVRAHHTITFELPKYAFMFHENASKVGNWHLLPIGLDPLSIEQAPSKFFYTDNDSISRIYRPRKKFSHKGTYGHALLIAGGAGKMGAAVLAAKGCLRSGVGLLHAHVPLCGVEVMQQAVPESMVIADSSEFIFTGNNKLEAFNAIGVGPGLGREEETVNGLKLLIQNTQVPMVLDADALNIVSENKTWLSFLPKQTILTPHVKEFERLAGTSSNDFERHQLQIEFAKKFGLIVILKGAHTCVVLPDGISYFNSTGNPGMASGGTGDVLCGIITGLLAQGYTPAESALLGVFIHGLSGDIAASELSQEALIAGDLINYLGKAFLEVNRNYNS